MQCTTRCGELSIILVLPGSTLICTKVNKNCIDVRFQLTRSWWHAGKISTNTCVFITSRLLKTKAPQILMRFSKSSFVDVTLLYSLVHYNDVIMRAIASQIISLTIVYSTIYSGTDERKQHQSSASLAFVRGLHRWPVNSPHKGPVTRKMFPFDDVIMNLVQGKFIHVLQRQSWECPRVSETTPKNRGK